MTTKLKIIYLMFTGIKTLIFKIVSLKFFLLRYIQRMNNAYNLEFGGVASMCFVLNFQNLKYAIESNWKNKMTCY